MIQPDDHTEQEELIYHYEQDIQILMSALKEIRKLPSVRMDEGSQIAHFALKSITHGGK